MKIKSLKKAIACLLVIVMCVNPLSELQINAAEEEKYEQNTEEQNTEEQSTNEQENTQEKSQTEDSESEQIGEVETQTESSGESKSELPEEETESTSSDDINQDEQDDTQAEYIGKNFTVVFRLTGQWDGGYNANIQIKNTGTSIIHNWYLRVGKVYNISNIWNAKIYKNENSSIVIKNADWNQDIPVNGNVEFGFSGTGEFGGFPEKYEIISDIAERNSDDYQVNYQLLNDWGSGFSANISITNNTDKVLEDWVVEFDFDRTINNIWNAEITDSKENHYAIKNAGYNSNIGAGQSISFGFNGYGASKDAVPSNYKIYSYGLSEVPSELEDFDFNDDDNDGLPNFYEDAIHSDKNNPDTDGDGLPDGYEIFTLLMYPTKADSDGNGISDSQEDSDGDGLSNLEEYELGINPRDPDTDGDGLPDALELKYGMNPNKQDTLNDRVRDGDRKFDIEVMGESSDNEAVTPHLTIELQGKQIDSLEIEKVEEDDQFLNSDVPGFLANAYDLSVDGDFDEAVLSFKLSDELLQRQDIEPAIYYWNEESQMLEEVAGQYREGSNLCAKLEHFSKYIVIARNIYEKEIFYYEILAPSEEEYMARYFDVSILLDESGSIKYNDYKMMKENSAELVGQLDDNDRVAVFTFDSVVRKKIGFSDKASAMTAIKSLGQHGGNTSIYNAISVATDEYIRDSDVSVSRVMILITDGYDNSGSRVNTAEAVSKKAAENKIVIYPIGVGSVNDKVLKTIAETTGGKYYYIDSFSQLSSVFDRIISDADLYRDSDNDGLSDYHEKKIAAGELRLGSGTVLKSFMKLDYMNPDSDGDGLPDGEELAIKEVPQGGNYYCQLLSNPCIIDTDADGLDDYVENYIGTSSTSDKNEVPEIVEGGLSVNKWYEWKELAESEAWNYIHNQVQKDARKHNNELYQSELTLPVGRADLYRERTEEIWEVKPASYAYEPKKTEAIDQLMRYVNSAKKYNVGGDYVKGNVFETDNNQYTVTYENMMNGLVLYHFEKKKPDATKVPVEEKEKEKDINYTFVAPYAVKEPDAWEKIAIAIIVGTIAEDVLTSGIGIADDVETISFALMLMGIE